VSVTLLARYCRSNRMVSMQRSSNAMHTSMRPRTLAAKNSLRWNRTRSTESQSRNEARSLGWNFTRGALAPSFFNVTKRGRALVSTVKGYLSSKSKVQPTDVRYRHVLSICLRCRRSPLSCAVAPLLSSAVSFPSHPHSTEFRSRRVNTAIRAPR